MSDALSRAIRSQTQQGRLGVIAEVKARRAGGVDLLRGRTAADIARAYRDAGATAISVVTSPWFGGHVRMLEAVAAANLGLPILRKDMIATDKAIDASGRLGASAVLLVLPLLGRERLAELVRVAKDLRIEPFVEVATRKEIETVRAIHDGIIAINNADVTNNEATGEGIARSVSLIERNDPRLWISASRIGGADDVKAVAAAGFDGLLIGTHLLLADDLDAATRSTLEAARVQDRLTDRRPLVKICGVTREEEVAALARLGVDFFGLVVDVPSPWSLTVERARALAAVGAGPMRPTLVTRSGPSQALERMIETIGARAVQLPAATSPDQVRQLRSARTHEELIIVQEIPYAQDQFRGEDRLSEYVEAGADLILLDKLAKSALGQSQTDTTIPCDALERFRQRHPGVPVVVAGGICADNARSLVAASGAVGIDVCSSVRRDGRISGELVEQLMAQIGPVA